MRMADIIEHKKQGLALTKEDLARELSDSDVSTKLFSNNVKGE